MTRCGARQAAEVNIPLPGVLASQARCCLPERPSLFLPCPRECLSISIFASPKEWADLRQVAERQGVWMQSSPRRKPSGAGATRLRTLTSRRSARTLRSIGRTRRAGP